MNEKCLICEYCDEDFVFDEKEGEEYLTYNCRKHNNISSDFECKDFKEYKPQSYIEKYTKCDKCKYFKECKEYLIDCTIYLDKNRHYINGIGHICKL